MSGACHLCRCIDVSKERCIEKPHLMMWERGWGQATKYWTSFMNNLYSLSSLIWGHSKRTFSWEEGEGLTKCDSPCCRCKKWMSFLNLNIGTYGKISTYTYRFNYFIYILLRKTNMSIYFYYHFLRKVHCSHYLQKFIPSVNVNLI